MRMSSMVRIALSNNYLKMHWNIERSSEQKFKIFQLRVEQEVGNRIVTIANVANKSKQLFEIFSKFKYLFTRSVETINWHSSKKFSFLLE